MSKESTKVDITKLSDAELIKLRDEHNSKKIISLFKLRSRETHEQKLYKQSKKLVAQINTELNARELLTSTNS